MTSRALSDLKHRQKKKFNSLPPLISRGYFRKKRKKNLCGGISFLETTSTFAKKRFCWIICPPNTLEFFCQCYYTSLLRTHNSETRLFNNLKLVLADSLGYSLGYSGGSGVRFSGVETGGSQLYNRCKELILWPGASHILGYGNRRFHNCTTTTSD